MSTKIMISVIVPVYNVEQYLERCLNSIINQDYTNLEIILIDDGSTDHSGEICDLFKKRDDRIRVIHKENGGLSSARNAGLEIAKGELLSFIDSDDWINLHAYSLLVELLEQYDADIVCFRQCPVYSNDVATIQDIQLEKKENETHMVLDRIQVLEKFLIGQEVDNSVWNKLYRREIFDDIRFNEGMIYEDMAIMHNCLYNAKKVVCIPKVLYYYYQRSDSILHSFSAKTFDFIVAAKMRADFFYEKCPELANKAVLTYIEGVFYLLWWSEHVNKGGYINERNRIAKELLEYLEKHSNIKMSRKMKYKVILLKLGLSRYDSFWNLYHIVLKKIGK